MNIRQWNGYGEVGAELALSRAVALQGTFRMVGVLSANYTENGANGVTIDPSKEDVGRSISRSASYVAGLSVGIYF
jgi:hypothetical protein